MREKEHYSSLLLCFFFFFVVAYLRTQGEFWRVVSSSLTPSPAVHELIFHLPTSGGARVEGIPSVPLGGDKKCKLFARPWVDFRSFSSLIPL